MIATRAPPSTGISASSPMRSLTPRNFGVGPADDDLATRDRPGPSRCRSGWPPCSTSRHARHGAARPVGRSGRAQQAGREVERERRLADPVGADEQDGVRRRAPDHGGRPRASAAACPRVRAPSMARRSGGLGVGGGILRSRGASGAGARRAVASRRGIGRPGAPWRPPACGSPAAWPAFGRSARRCLGRAGARHPSARGRPCAWPTLRRGSRASVRRGLAAPRPAHAAGVFGAARGRPAFARSSGSTGASVGHPSTSTAAAARTRSAGSERGFWRDLGAKHGLELGRHVAPRLVRAARLRRRAAGAVGRSIAAAVARSRAGRRGRLTRSGRSRPG